MITSNIKIEQIQSSYSNFIERQENLWNQVDFEQDSSLISQYEEKIIELNEQRKILNQNESFPQNSQNNHVVFWVRNKE